MLRHCLLILAALVPIACQAADKRPNVVVIMVDDLGYSDLGCYGGEIETPNLDRLADNGLRFSQFYNTAKCHSSRVSLLSGQYCIAAGDVAMTHAVTSAEVLGDGGYFTAMTGKWHLDRQPTDFGFDRYFGHLSGACNFFLGDKTFRLNGQPWQVPSEGFYTTVANVDYGLQFLSEARQTQKPWYLYVAFNAPHSPLHALPEDYEKYKGRYASGWDKVRAARVEKQKRMGLLPANLTESPRPEHVPDWDTMEPWRQDFEENRMTTLAAMIDRVDQEVGRLIDDLTSHEELDNTLILFVSDNGACPYDRQAPKLEVVPTNGGVAFSDSTGWSWARNTPFRYYKQNQFEGGISTPAIVHWPNGLKTTAGSIVNEPAHLIDVMPTLADITQCDIPGTWPGRDLRPLSGVSLKPIFDGGSLGDERPIHLLFAKDRGLRQGDWKAVSFQGTTWELYNVAEDRTELNDLAQTYPDRLDAMVATWTAISQEILHAPAKTFAPVTEATLPHRHREWTKFDSKKPSATQPKNGKPNLSGIRARKNTTMTIDKRSLELNLEFTGDDPGIAMDLRHQAIAKGPYRLSFDLTAGGKFADGIGGGGEVFYTTDPKTSLPNGQRIPFDVTADGQRQAVSIDLPTDGRIYQLRIDVSDGPGTATLSQIRLIDPNDVPVAAWPPGKPQPSNDR